MWSLAGVSRCEQSGGRVLGGGVSGVRPIGQELAQWFGGMGADALEDVAEIGEGIDTRPFACGDEAGEDGGGSPSVSMPSKSPGPRAHEEADMRRTRHFGQLGLDSAPRSGIMNAGQRDAALSEKAAKRFFGDIVW